MTSEEYIKLLPKLNKVINEQMTKIENVDTINEMIQLRDEIIGQVSVLKNVEEREMLVNFYLYGISMVKIADIRSQSTDWIKKLKNRGIAHLKVNYSECLEKCMEILG